MSTDHMYLENIDEFICDENKIVTYRWLSLTLNISSNVAKQMLYHYYDHCKEAGKDKCDLSATYLLTGIEHDNNLNQDVYKVCLVRDNDLEATKGRFKQVFSLHIYSLQKGQLKDLHILYGNDYDKIRENAHQSTRYSSIICPSASVRLPKEVIQPEKELNVSKGSHLNKPKVAVKEENTENKENKSDVENTRARPVTKTSNKGSIASLFANQAKKIETKNIQQTKPQLSNSKKLPTKSSLGAPKKGSLASFLTKGPQPPKSPRKEEKPAVVNADSIEVTRSPSKDSPKKTATTSSHSKEVKKETIQKKSPKIKPKPSLKGKRKPSATRSSPDTKRRRIVTMDSSSESSSDEEIEPMEECPLPSPPPAVGVIQSDDDDEVIPPTPEGLSQKDGDISSGKRRRKKKLVDKTYVDEDGYIVTNKEYELVSDSDEENPIPSVPKEKPLSTRGERTSPTKNKSPSPVKGANKKSPVKMKQASIMSFFQKK